MAKKKKEEETIVDTEAVKLSEKMTGMLADAEKGKRKSDKRVDDSNNFYVGDEWELATGTKPDCDRLSLKIPKAISETIIGSILENKFEAEVLADEVPLIPNDHPYKQIIGQLGDELMLGRSMDEAKIVSELATHGLGSIDEKLKIDEKLAHLLEKTLVDGGSWIKDGIDYYEPDNLCAKVVSKKEITKDPNAKVMEDLEWLCHSIPSNLDELEAKYPEHAGRIKAEAKQDETTNGDENPRYILEEWWIRDREMVVDEHGVEYPKYPGFWMQAFRVGSLVLEHGPNPFPHGRLPFHHLVGVSDPDSLDGLSLVMDILFGLCTGLNKTTSLAIWNLLSTSTNQRVWDVDKLLNPEAIGDNSIQNLKVKPGESLDSAVRDLTGQQVSPAFFQIADLINGKLVETSGAGSIPQPGQKDANDIVHSGFRKGMLRRRVKTLLESLYYNLLHNLISLVDEDRSYQLMGGLGPSYFSFNPHILDELINYFNARFTIFVKDEELLPSDPFDRAKLTTEMLKVAGEIRQLTGIPLSEAVGLLPNMPDKSRLSRQIQRVEEIQRRSDEQTPEEKEIEAQGEKEREGASNEVMKHTLKKVADEDAILSVALRGAGIDDAMFRLDKMDLAELVDTMYLIQAMNQQLFAATGGNQFLGAMDTSVQLRIRGVQQRQAQQQAEQAQQQAEQAQQQAEQAQQGQGGV